MRRRLVVGLLLTSLLGGCGAPDEQVTSGSTTTAAPGAGWEQLPPSPLSPRGGAVLTTLEDGRLLVVGGDMVAGCQDHRTARAEESQTNESAAASGEVAVIRASALSCVPLPHDPRFNDGAILESASGEWKPIADAPAPLSDPSRGVVLGDSVYFWSWPSFAASGPTEGTWISYDVSDDKWKKLADPPDIGHRGFLKLVRSADGIIAFHGTEENGAGRDLLYDPKTDSWMELPQDPLSPSFDRLMVWTGREVVLLAHEIVANPGSERPSVVRAAAFDPETHKWRRLSDSESLGGSEWWWSGGRVVNAALGESDGGETGNYGRGYPNGALLDPATGEWSSLPPGPPAPANCESQSQQPSFDPDLGYHAAGPDVVVNDGLALHVAASRWEPVPCNPPQGDFKFASTWAFDGLVAFGGYDQFGDTAQSGTKYEFSNAAWLWQPAK